MISSSIWVLYLIRNLSWTEHVNYMSSNISKRIGVICRVQYYLPSNTTKLLAKAMVLPHFDYCSPVWSNFTTGLHNHLQILQNKLARVLLLSDIRTPIDKMMEELNWLKVDDRWKRQLLVVHREIVPPRETVAIARVAVAIVGERWMRKPSVHFGK